MAGRKSLFHEGAQVSLTTQINHETLRLSMNAQIEDGAPFVFAIPAIADMRQSWLIATRVSELLTSARRHAKRAPRGRPSRQALVHMRSLQALDGESYGASHRDIAMALFGESDVWQRWATNSELRAQVRYLLRRGRHFAKGGYRRLLMTATASAGQGDFSARVDSP